VAVVVDIHRERLEVVGLAVVLMVGQTVQVGLTQHQILVAVVVDVVEMQTIQAATAALASSSSRSINNEDKWKPKSIGCTELTPQCTC
jgi:hypothetical protein